MSRSQKRIQEIEDLVAVRRFDEALARGDEELLPAAMVERMLAGEHPIRVWRQHRGMSVESLAEAAGISQPYLTQIETGKREGSANVLRRIAEALRIAVDDIV